MQLLHLQAKSIFLVSGGFRPIINPIADMLNISRDHVFANTILFGVSLRLVLVFVRHTLRVPRGARAEGRLLRRMMATTLDSMQRNSHRAAAAKRPLSDTSK